MLFDSLLISSILLASVVLADLHLGNREPSILNYTEDATTGHIPFSSGASAVWQEGDNTFNYVTGTFTVPGLTGEHGSVALTWVGIDGFSCSDVTFLAGVDFSVDSNGKTSYRAWCQWYPDYLYTFDLVISPGDEIRLWVHAYFPTSGIAKVHNLSTNKYAVRLINNAPALCGKDAAWSVQALLFNGAPVPLADFGTVTFRDTKAAGPHGSRTASGATPVDLVQGSRTVARTGIDGSSVTINYV